VLMGEVGKGIGAIVITTLFEEELCFDLIGVVDVKEK